MLSFFYDTLSLNNAMSTRPECQNDVSVTLMVEDSVMDSHVFLLEGLGL
jgi:hypothetical protein